MFALLEAFLLPVKLSKTAVMTKWLTALVVAKGTILVDDMKDRKIKEQDRNEKLGITPSRDPLSKAKLEERRKLTEMAREMGFDISMPANARTPENAFNISIIEEKNLIPSLKQYAGEWLLTEEEKDMLSHGLKLIGLQERKGPDAEKLQAISEATGIRYEEWSFIWEGFRPDLENLRRLSNNRLSDVRLRKSLTDKVE